MKLSALLLVASVFVFGCEPVPGEGEGEGEGEACVPEESDGELVTVCDGDAAVIDSCDNVVEACDALCRPLLEISRAVCGVAGQPGDRCTSEASPFPCAEGLFCIETQGEISECFAAAVDGAQCFFDDLYEVPCEAGFTCDPTQDVPICVPE